MSARFLSSPRSVHGALVLTAFLCPAAMAATPSFLCSKAISWVEKTICASERLSTLDLELASTYANSLRSAGSSGERELTAGQQRWWAGRDECRRQVDPDECLENRYVQRIAVLKARPGYTEERRVRIEELPPEELSAVGEGWSRSLSRYVKAIRACLAQAPAPVRYVASARDDTTYTHAVAVYLRGPAHQSWVCTAQGDGTHVLAWHELGSDADAMFEGPRFYPDTRRPADACGTPVKVLDEADTHVGWIGPGCAVVGSHSR